MRQFLSTAVSAVLLSTAACVSEPAIIKPATSETSASGPAAAGNTAAPQAEAAPGIPAGWKWVSSAEGGFRAAFPSTPKLESEDVNTGFGRSRNLTYGAASKSDGTYVVVMVTKFPPGMDGLKNSDDMLKGARNGALQQANARVMTEKPVTMEGPARSGGRRSFPGLEYSAIGPDGLRFAARIVITEDRILQAMFMHKDEARETFDQFLSTFSLQ